MTKIISYFAYGSNMFLPQIEKRLQGDYKKKALGVLKGYSFLYNKLGNDGSGKANIVRNNNDKVLGIVYELSIKSLEIMNNFEKGYSYSYIDVFVNNKVINCITYIADKHKTGLLPTKNYKNTILTNAIQDKFPKDYINYLSNFETFD